MENMQDLAVLTKQKISRLKDLRKNASLEILCKEILNRQANKNESIRMSKWHKDFNSQMLSYAIDDVLIG